DPSIFVVAGGHHASMCPADFDVAWVDAIVLGDGERTIRRLCSQLAQHARVDDIGGLYLRRGGRWTTTGADESIASLDETPFPNRELVQPYRHQYFFWF